ncbi:MAG: hypothetical protein ACC682_10030 [Gemmatimonadota bacterium]
MRPGIRRLPRVAAAVGALVVACAPPPDSLQPPLPDLGRAEVNRCSASEPRLPITAQGVERLTGRYVLFMVGEEPSLELAKGNLILDVASGDSGGMGTAPTLTGMTDVDASVVGAMIPGDARSTEAMAPGVGVYTFDDPANPGTLIAVVRLGAEANRRDRQRFDGAHTTLRITSVAPDRFGGTWTSANGGVQMGGEFCAVRTSRGLQDEMTLG